MWYVVTVRELYGDAIAAGEKIYPLVGPFATKDDAALGYGYAGREAGRVRELERWTSPP